MNSRRLIQNAFIGTFALGLVACGGEGNTGLHPDDVVLVEVGGEPVTKAMLEVVMESRGVTPDEPERMRELLDGLIRLQVVANQAEQQGLADSVKVAAERRIADLRVQNLRYIEHYQQENPITETDIQAVYREQVDRSGDRRYRIEAVPFADQVEALAAINAVNDGERSFEQVTAAAEELGASVMRPDWIDLSQVPVGFADALSDAEVGSVLPVPQAMGDSWLAVRLVDTQELTPPPLAEVREGIRRTLESRQGEALVEELFQGAAIVPMLPLDAAADPESADSEAGSPGGDDA